MFAFVRLRTALALVLLSATGCVSGRPPPGWLGWLPEVKVGVGGGQSIGLTDKADGQAKFSRKNSFGVSLGLCWKFSQILAPADYSAWEKARHAVYLARRRWLEQRRRIFLTIRAICTELHERLPYCPVASDLKSLLTQPAR